MEKPEWLPEMVPVSGVWDDVLVALYRVFETGFKKGGCKFEGRPVWWDRRILPGDKVTVELSPYDLTRGRITYRVR